MRHARPFAVQHRPHLSRPVDSHLQQPADQHVCSHNGTLDDDDLNSFVDALVRRLASFDRETLAAAKAQINRFGTPTVTELQSSNDMFFSTLASSSAQARRAKVRSVGYGVPSEFELNFGRYLPALGRADGDDTDTKTGHSSLGGMGVGSTQVPQGKPSTRGERESHGYD